MPDEEALPPAGSPCAASPLPSVPGAASVHATLVLVQVAFGSLAVEGKVAMSPRFGVSPPALAMVRILGGALLFVSLRLATPGRVPVATLRDAAGLALLSLLGIVLNQALFLLGLRQTSPVSATLLVATIPVFTAIIGALAGKDRLTARNAGGVALALLGVGVLTGFAVPQRGDAMVLLNAASYAAYVVFSKRALARYGTLTVLAWIFGAGALIFAPLGGPALVREAAAWTGPTVGLVAFIVLVPTAFAYSASAWALGRTTPSLVTIYIYLQPLVVAALAWVQLGQPPQGRAILAGALILAGVTVVVSARGRPR